MAIKDIICSGIGFNPGSVKFIPTRGFISGAEAAIPESIAMSFNDCKGEFYTKFGFTGSNNDKELAWLVTKVLSPEGNSRRDLWYKYLVEQGSIHSQLNDMLMQWLGSFGYTGNLNDRWIQYWGCDIPTTASLTFRGRRGIGVTTDLDASIVAQWFDFSGLGHHLVQATDANKPAFLGYGGINYLWHPGIAGNYASTPDAAPIDIVGDIDIRVKLSADDWTPGTIQTLVSKWLNTGDQRSWGLYLQTTGELELQTSVDGIATSFTNTSTVPTGFANGTVHWVRVVFDVDWFFQTLTRFWTSEDGVTWIPLGDNIVVGAPTSIFNSTATLDIGAINAGVGFPLAGKVFQAQVLDGWDGTVEYNANFEEVAEGAASFNESSVNAALVTINSTAGWPAQIVGASNGNTILFDGIDNFLRAAGFTLNQPTTVYLLAKQVTHVANDTLVDGNTAGSGAIIQAAASPDIKVTAGTDLGDDSNLILDTYGVIVAVFNGASSVLRVDNNAPINGAAGALNMSGLTLGAAGSSLLFSNIHVSELLVYALAHDTATQDDIVDYLQNMIP